MKFTEDHEWLIAEGDTVTVGITEHAASQLGDVVFIELPAVGDDVSKGDDCAVIESVKAASDILAPIDGEIIEVNEELAEEPGTVNGAAMDAWFFKIKASELSQLEEFMDEDAYKAHIG